MEAKGEKLYKEAKASKADMGTRETHVWTVVNWNGHIRLGKVKMGLFTFINSKNLGWQWDPKSVINISYGLEEKRGVFGTEIHQPMFLRGLCEPRDNAALG